MSLNAFYSPHLLETASGLAGYSEVFRHVKLAHDSIFLVGGARHQQVEAQTEAHEDDHQVGHDDRAEDEEEVVRLGLVQHNVCARCEKERGIRSPISGGVLLETTIEIRHAQNRDEHPAFMLLVLSILLGVPSSNDNLLTRSFSSNSATYSFDIHQMCFDVFVAVHCDAPIAGRPYA